MTTMSEVVIKFETPDAKKAVGDLETLRQSTTKASQAARKNTSAMSAETAEIRRETLEINKRKAQIALETAEIKKQTAELRQQKTVRAASIGVSRKVERLATGVDPLSGKMARDLGVNRFNTANIAAQFQDIGVTAAMGMNPLTIALQQGTQLSAILNNMGNPLKGLAQAFSQLINPVALVSIGLTGLIAALVQMVDWSKVWEGASNLLADSLDFLADNFYILATAMGTFVAVEVLSNLNAIWSAIAGLIPLIGKLAVNLYKMGAAWLVGMGPVGWAVIGITGLITVLHVFREELKNLLGFDLLDVIKTAMNGLIANFRNGLQVLLNITTNFVTLIRKAFYEMMDTFIDVQKFELSVGSFGGLGLSVKDPVGALAKEFAKLEEQRKVLQKEIKAQQLPSVESILLEGVEDSFVAPKDYIGSAYDSITELIHKAADKIRNAGKDVEDASKEAWDKIVKGIEGHKLEMVQEADLLGRIGEDYYITKEKYDLLNKAREAGITLNEQQIKYIEEESLKLGQQASALDRLKQGFDFTHSATTSFFTDMNHALLEGQTLWEAFGDAVMNVLTKILDKMTEIGVDSLFAAGKAAGWFGGAGTQVYSSAIGPTQTAGASGFYGMALGGAWDRGVQKFATGGVVGSPTLFGARNGLGLMGEAGPEAIMPLTRGANGELGVKAEGIGGSPVVVNVINNSNSKATVNQRQTSQGTEIDVVIDQLVGEKLGTLGTASNTAMNTWNNRQLIAR